MEVGNIKPDMAQVIKDAATGSATKGESAVALDGTISVYANPEAARSNTEALKELLISYGLIPGAENTELLLTLLENGMASNKESILRLNQALKLYNTMGQNIEGDMATHASNLEKALFTLKNQLPLTGDTVRHLEHFLGEGKSVSLNMDMIAAEISKAESTHLLSQVINILSGSQPAEGNLAEGTAGNPSPELENTNIPVPEAPPSDLADEGISINQRVPSEKIPQAVQQASPEQRQEILKLAGEFIANPEAAPLKALAEAAQRLVNTENTNPLDNEPLSRDQIKAIVHQIAGSDLPEFSKAFDKALQSSENPAGKEIAQLAEKLFGKLRIDPQDNRMEKLEGNLNELKYRVGEALKAAERSGEKLPEPLTKALQDLNNNLEFINQLKTCVYVPIPLNLPTGQADGELYVFKDKRTKNRNGAKSALIGLNTVSLGRVEAYIQKQENLLNLQFRLENAGTSKIITTHYEKLVNLLNDAGLKLTGFSVMPLDAPFDILQKEPAAKTTNYDPGKTFDVKA